MLPSAIPKLVQCKSTSTCMNTEYTTIAKLILRASNKVNGGHTVAHCGWANLSHDASRHRSTASEPPRIRCEPCARPTMITILEGYCGQLACLQHGPSTAPADRLYHLVDLRFFTVDRGIGAKQWPFHRGLA